MQALAAETNVKLSSREIETGPGHSIPTTNHADLKKATVTIDSRYADIINDIRVYDRAVEL